MSRGAGIVGSAAAVLRGSGQPANPSKENVGLRQTAATSNKGEIITKYRSVGHICHPPGALHLMSHGRTLTYREIAWLGGISPVPVPPGSRFTAALGWDEPGSFGSHTPNSSLEGAGAAQLKAGGFV